MLAYIVKLHLSSWLELTSKSVLLLLKGRWNRACHALQFKALTIGIQLGASGLCLRSKTQTFFTVIRTRSSYSWIISLVNCSNVTSFIRISCCKLLARRFERVLAVVAADAASATATSAIVVRSNFLVICIVRILIVKRGQDLIVIVCEASLRLLRI